MKFITTLFAIAGTLKEWRRKGSKETSNMYLGTKCGECQDPNWHGSKKG